MKSVQSINKDKQSGQSLVESIIAMGIIITTLVALMSAVTYALNNAQFARNKALATKYTQESVEWLRGQRDSSWNTFVSFSSAGGSTYCLNGDLHTQSTMPGIAKSCTASPIDAPIDDQYDIFNREVTLTTASTGRVAITVRVYWYEGTRVSDVVVNTYLTRWR